jgi:RNA polymerase sigma-70 factor (ECF subfamily)
MVAVDPLTRLAVAAREGDRAALAAFVERSQADVWRFCRYLVGREAADDATQETFERAIGALRSYRAEASARTWLLSIARRTCVDVVRRACRRRSLLDRLSHRVVDGSLPLGGTAEVEAVLVQLDSDQRQAFILTQLLGLTYQDAADVCGCPVGTIRSRVARARATLVDVLDDDAAAER